MTELTKEQAVSVLIQAAKIAQSKGAFTLDDAAMVSMAIKAFTPPQAADAIQSEEQTEAEAPSESN
jgi:hypothetical protein